MGLTIPRSIRLEHGKLHEDLSKIIASGGKVGKAAGGVATALHKHFGKEEKYAMPPLGVLADISSGKKIKDAKKVIDLTKKLEKYLPEMLKEHKLIVRKLEVLKKISKKEKNKEALAFVNGLKLHALSEEEILYPASTLIGKYLREV